MARTIKTIPEMVTAMTAEIESSPKKQSIYKTQSEAFKKAELATDIGRAINTLSSDCTRVDFYDIDDVRRRITDYFTACSQAGIYPSVQGLASYGFGISRQALNQWRNRPNNRGTEVANLIDRACDMMADILTNQALRNNANAIQAIFQLKNNHAFADRVEIEPVQGEGYDNRHELSEDELRRKYMDIAYQYDAETEP